MIATRHSSTPIADYEAYGARIGDVILGTEGIFSSYVMAVHAEDELARIPREAPRVLKFAAYKGGIWMGSYCTLAAARHAAGL